MNSKSYSFQKVTQLPQGNNVLDAPETNKNGFLWRDSCLISTQKTISIWKKKAYLQLVKPQLQEALLSKTNRILIWQGCPIC
jgi:hypothetical protein